MSEFLRARQDEIVAIWTERVRALSPAREAPNLTIIDHLPQILARIADVVASAPDGQPPSLADGPESHAVDRLARGFDLKEVIQEYTMLRQVILNVFEQDVGPAINLGEVKRLDAAIDRSIEESCVRFAAARQRTLTALDRISETAVDTRDLDAFLRQLLRATLESTESVDTGVVFLREGEGLRAWAAAGLEEGLERQLRLEPGEGFAGRIAQEGRPLFLRHAAADPNIKSEIIRIRGVRALYGVPLTHDNKVIGVAYVGSTTAFEFSDDDRLLFRTMASRAAGVIVQAQLASALEQRALEFGTLADNMAQLAWMADETGSVFWYNKRWVEYTGITLDEMKGWGWTKVHHPQHVDRVVEKFRRCLQTGEAWEDTFPIRGRNGEFRWFLSRAMPIRDAEGRVTRWLGTNTDVSGEREAIRLRDEILAAVSHDLRNPLNAVQITANQLATKLLASAADPKLRRFAEIIQRAAGHMEHLITDLLDLATIRAGGLVIERHDQAVDSLIEEAVETQAPLASEKGIELRSLIELPSGAQVNADRGRLLQVLGNLLGNAIKFCRSGDQVTVRAAGTDDQILFTVEDNGPGIPHEHLEHIFDPYWSGEGDTHRGTGLGLYISKGIIERHGGHLGVDSKLGVGSKFFFAIPRATETRPGPEVPTVH